MANSRKTLGLLLAALLLAAPALAYHQGETLRMKFQTFTIHGSVSKHSCSGQANVKSERGHMVGVAVHWRVGKSVMLLAQHPEYASAGGRQKIRFIFPDGKTIVLPMKLYGKQLQVPIGIGSQGLALYHALMDNPSVTVELTGIDDVVRVDLSDRFKAEQGALYCREWLHA
ncbi:MAG: hypothetical protein K8F59_00980 [Rhodobacteraceae bacterium]|nr:hypothetical protein [Paracoccaceae bacterium]